MLMCQGKKYCWQTIHWRGGEHRGTLCSHLIFLEFSLWRKNEERKKKSCQCLCGNLVVEICPVCEATAIEKTWQRIFLNPRKPQGLYLEGVIQGEMEMDHLKNSMGHLQSLYCLQRTRPNPTAPEELPSSKPFLFILQCLFLYFSKMLW